MSAAEDLRPMTAEELAAQLDVDRKTVYAMAERGEIPGVIRLGRLLKFARPAVIAWLREGNGPTRARRKR